jgi:amino acid adenylation domain-containing protein
MSVAEIITLLKQYQVVPRAEGDGLRLGGNVQQLPADVLEAVRSGKEELLQWLKQASRQIESNAILPVPTAPHYPLSPAQKRIWVLSQFDGGNAAYNITTHFWLKGTVDRQRLQRALDGVVQRHESLRTVFREQNGLPVQVVLGQVQVPVVYKDCQAAPDKPATVRQLLEQSGSDTFNLAQAPLLRLTLAQLASDEWLLVLCLHHIISDGWSVAVLMQELLQAYANPAAALPILPIQYKEYNHWQGQRLQGPSAEAARRFWKEEWQQPAAPLNLPYSFPRPPMQHFAGAAVKYYLDEALYNDIKAFCQAQRITLFHFLRATVAIWLYKLTGQTIIPFGTPVAGRNHQLLQQQLGLYVNTLPLKTLVEEELPFADWLQQVAAHTAKAFEHQVYPLDKIMDDLALKRSADSSPLFDVMLVLQDMAPQQTAPTATDFILHTSDPDWLMGQHLQRAAKFDLTLSGSSDSDNRFYIELEYATALFTRQRIEQMSRSLLYIMRQVLARPQQPIAQLQAADAGEQHKILQVFNRPIGEVHTPSIAALLKTAFERFGDGAAVKDAAKVYTYAQLQQYAGSIAGQLSPLITANARPFVGLMVSRSADMLAAIVGILQAGGAYVPIDITYPSSRVDYIINDAQLELIVVDNEGQERVPASFTGRIVHIHELLQGQPAAVDTTTDRSQQTAYLIYTSGSTGQPKGVEITHQNAIAFLQWSMEEFAGTDYTTLYATTSYCFDLSVFEFFVPLLQGKTIRVLPSALEIPTYLQQDGRVMLNTVPSVVRNLLDSGLDWSPVTALNMAGEPIPKKIKAEIDYKRIAVRNLYGPSEDTTYSTVYRFTDDQLPFIPIGVPVGYSQLYILNAQGQLQPEGVEGELYLSGLSVAKGYYNRPELTAERFLPNPFVPGQRLYKTGDVGKWLPDGQVAFSGRADDQVKVRGYRIELGEIEFLLEQHPQVEQAVVAIKSINGAPEMVAYWMGGNDIRTEDLKPWLAQQVPGWMVPLYWVRMEAIPLNSNGKTDKAQLPLPLAVDGGEAVAAPTSELEAQLVAIWQQVLPQAGTLGTTHNFFNVGGHSLHAVQLRSLILQKIGKELSLSELFLLPTVRQQAQALQDKATVQQQAIAPIPPQAHYPISLAQQRLWVLAGFEAASRAYHMPAAFRVNGNLAPDLLEVAFRQVIQRHEVLRTVFATIDGLPVQRVLPDGDSLLTIERFDTGAATADDLAVWIQQHGDGPFDMQQGPLLRCWLLQTGFGQVLYCNMHHIIGDGWSVIVLYREVIEAYRRMAEGKGREPLPLAIQYKDVAVWQRQQLSGTHLQRLEAFWQQQFADGIPVLELPTDFHRPDTKTYNGAVHRMAINSAATQQLQALAQTAGVPLYTVLMAGVNTLLKKYANQTDIVAGTTVAGRDLTELHGQIGFYVNALPVRTKVEGHHSFNSLLAQQQEILLGVYEHQEYPFEKMVSLLKAPRNLSRSPLFDVMVVLQNLPGQEALARQQVTKELAFEQLPLHSGTAKYDLTFLFEEKEEGLQLLLEYNTGLYLPETVQQMARHLLRILEQVSARPDTLIKDIVLLDSGERQLLLSKADNTAVGYDTDATIVSLFGKAAAHFADHTALEVDDRRWTYRQLDQMSGQLARQLMQGYGVGAQDFVVLHTDRSEWMLVAILGVLKAGAAYVPTDPAYPADRINYIIGDSQTRLVLGQGEMPPAVTDAHPAVRYLDITALDYSGDTAQADVQPHHLAYMIYTSGTTGQPKGVLIEHRNVARLLFTDNDLFGFDHTDRWSLFHSYCFDFSVWEMYGALLYGGTLVMVPKATAQDSRAFYDFLADTGITVLNQTPTAFRSLVQQNKERFLSKPLHTRYLIFGGEALLPELLREWHHALPGCQNINMYGITETTVHVTYKAITDADIKANKSNIGVPIPTLSCYVLDRDLQQVPVGVVGELCVGGAGVARGYLNRPELTTEKFIDNPIRPGETVYRSGDYARILPNGDLEYIGRRDDQVKIRGHRIETGEVEKALLQLPGIQDAVVLAIQNGSGEHELAAYYIPATGNHPPVRNSLQQQLPAYMVPAYLIPLAAFPLNSNGKLDKPLLPLPQQMGRQNEYVPPRHDIDRDIIAIWEAVLERPTIGIEDNFFELGGHSLKATQVIGRINDLYNIKIDLKEIFTEPTVAHLSNYVESVLWTAVNETAEAGDGEKMVF